MKYNSLQLGYQFLSMIRGLFYVLPLIVGVRHFLMIQIIISIVSSNTQIHIRFHKIIIYTLGFILAIMLLLNYTSMICLLIGIILGIISNEAQYHQKTLEKDMEYQITNLDHVFTFMGFSLFYNFGQHYLNSYSIIVFILMTLYRLFTYNYDGNLIMLDNSYNGLEMKKSIITFLFAIPSYYGLYIFLKQQQQIVNCTLCLIIIQCIIYKYSSNFRDTLLQQMIIIQIISLIFYFYCQSIFSILQMTYICLFNHYFDNHFQDCRKNTIKLHKLFGCLGNLVVIILII